MRTSLFLGTALSVFLLSGLASAAKVNYQATLDSAQETTPPTVVTGTGKANATYDTDTKKFCVLVEYKDIGGPANAAHIHEGARGSQGSAVMNFNPPFDSPLGEEFDLSADAMLQAKLAGNSMAFYVNIHTDADQTGAVRGQLEPGGPEVSCDETPEDAGTSSGSSGTSSGASSGTSGTSGTTPTDGGTSSSSGSDDSSSSCSTTKSSPLSTGGPILLGLAIAGAVASRARRKK